MPETTKRTCGLRWYSSAWSAKSWTAAAFLLSENRENHSGCTYTGPKVG